MVIELSGVQFGLNVVRVRFEITQYKVWFQKKIARQLPLVKSPLYYSHFEIAEFSQYQYERSSTRAGGAPYLSKSTFPRKFGNHVTVHRPSTVRPHLGISMFTLTFSSYFGSLGENWLHINVVINWRLSKQGIRWPILPDRIAGSGQSTHRYPFTSSIFEVICWQVTSFQMIAGSSLIF